MNSSRRKFLNTAGYVGLGTLCGNIPIPALPCGAQKDVLPFVNEGNTQLNTLLDQGLKGRLVLDLSSLEKSRLITLNDSFFIRTRFPAKLRNGDEWSIRITGLKGKAMEVSVSALRAAEVPMGVHLLECSGNSAYRNFGLMSAANWSGVSLKQLFTQNGVSPATGWLNIKGFDKHIGDTAGSMPGASWIFPYDSLINGNAFLATGMNGQILSKDHGWPIRLIMPGWYGCANIKWVEEIRFVGEDEPPTSQMQEYAGRTHQKGNIQVVRNFSPAEVDLTAMPIRVERWRGSGTTKYRITGLQWGQGQPSRKLKIRDNPDRPFKHVDNYLAGNAGWSLWSHQWKPEKEGKYTFQLMVDDPTVRTRRLDLGYYNRSVVLSG